ncbi:unnamed protein product [Gadus morhua 'NCC']
MSDVMMRVDQEPVLWPGHMGLQVGGQRPLWSCDAADLCGHVMLPTSCGHVMLQTFLWSCDATDLSVSCDAADLCGHVMLPTSCGHVMLQTFFERTN